VQLVNRAVAHLPMPKRRAKLKVTAFGALALPEMASRVVELAEAERRERVRQDAARHASRIFANALLNTAWRNGPVENIHGGAFRGYPMDQRRMMPAEERELMSFTSERLALGMTVCLSFAREDPRRPWPEQVLPYGLAEPLLVTPSRWTLTETSREVRLRLPEGKSTALSNSCVLPFEFGSHADRALPPLSVKEVADESRQQYGNCRACDPGQARRGICSP
jgi:hypothetical protein